MFHLWVFIFEYDSNCFRCVTHFEFDSRSTHDLLVSKICFVIRFSIYFDGKTYDKTYITHEQIMSGATVEFEMSNTPKAIGVIFKDKNP